MRLYNGFFDRVAGRFLDTELKPAPTVTKSNYEQLGYTDRPYEVGRLVVHGGSELHAIPPPVEPREDDHRITVQGWGVFSEGEWVIFS